MSEAITQKEIFAAAALNSLLNDKDFRVDLKEQGYSLAQIRKIIAMTAWAYADAMIDIKK